MFPQNRDPLLSSARKLFARFLTYYSVVVILTWKQPFISSSCEQCMTNQRPGLEESPPRCCMSKGDFHEVHQWHAESVARF